MLSALIRSAHSYPAVPLARQPEHQGCVIPGPLVLGNVLLKSPAPAEDMDQTVSRRFEPSSRTALIGEQPNPWDLLQPQEACYPQSTFYPLSDGATTSHRRITKSCFRICSTCWSRS